MRSDEEVSLIADKLYREAWPKVGDAIYADAECIAQSRLICGVVLTAEDADRVTDEIERIAIAREEEDILAGITHWVTAEQVEELSTRIEQDRAGHVAAHGTWKADCGKVERMLNLSGVGVVRPKGPGRWAFVIACDENRMCGLEDMVTLHVVTAASLNEAEDLAFAERAKDTARPDVRTGDASYHYDHQRID